MTPREPDRYEAIADQIVTRSLGADELADDIAAALRAVEADALERAAQAMPIAQGYGPDLARKIRALASPASRAAALAAPRVPELEPQTWCGVPIAPPSEPAAPAPASQFLTETELAAAEDRIRAADRLAALFGGDLNSEFSRMVAEIRFRRAPAQGAEARDLFAARLATQLVYARARIAEVEAVLQEAREMVDVLAEGHAAELVARIDTLLAARTSKPPGAGEGT